MELVDGRSLAIGATGPDLPDGGILGPPADVYGLGVVRYEAIAGDLPWPARVTADLIAAHRHVTPKPPTGHPAGRS
jgi:hypothetical protein